MTISLENRSRIVLLLFCLLDHFVMDIRRASGASGTFLCHPVRMCARTYLFSCNSKFFTVKILNKSIIILILYLYDDNESLWIYKNYII